LDRVAVAYVQWLTPERLLRRYFLNGFEHPVAREIWRLFF